MSGREREIFLLPCCLGTRAAPRADFRKLSRCVQRRSLRKLHSACWADEAVLAMNELSGVSLDAIAACANGPIRNQGQTLALDRIDSIYKRIPPPPSSLSPAGAFRELCGTASRYEPCDATSTAPYDKDLISWPPVGTVPVSTIGSLEGTDRL